LAERATYRTVVLLRPSDKLKLDRLAAQNNVSSGEVIRRSLNSYQSVADEVREAEEQKLIAATLKMMTDALAEANISMTKTNAKLDKLHRQLKSRDFR
jgi:uncharacterized coiled-coil protein SlyX